MQGHQNSKIGVFVKWPNIYEVDVIYNEFDRSQFKLVKDVFGITFKYGELYGGDMINNGNKNQQYTIHNQHST